MSSTEALWDELVGEMRAVARLEQVRAVLAWDQQTQLPADAGEARAEQLALLSSIHHARFTAPRVGDLLEDLSGRADLGEDRAAGVANLRRDWRREVAVPPAVVERLARLQGLGHTAWMEAREQRSYERFAPVLADLVAVSKERAAAIDPDRAAYDVLLDEFEPGMTARALAPTFTRLREGLRVLLEAIREVEPLPRLEGSFDPAAQLRLSEDLGRALGYDLRAGRIDLATHPFTINLGPGDVRITTRTDPDDLLPMLGGTMHELGHALYEQGLPSLVGTGLDGAASMGLHESQSRFWENTIGRSLPFFRWLQGPLAARFGSAPAPEALYRAANRVAPGSNRVEADEVTYNLHVIVRFELEQALFADRLRVADLREAWNEAYRQTLGVDPVDDLDGVLQDIHWSGAAFGYFPTYTIGNLYAATLGRKLQADLPGLWDLVGQGNFAPILAWLREQVHRHGRRWPAPTLVARAIGAGDDGDGADLDQAVDALLGHLWGRHGALHGVDRSAERRVNESAT